MLSLVVAEAKGRKQMEKQKQARRSRLKSRILTLLVVEVAMQGAEVCTVFASSSPAVSKRNGRERRGAREGKWRGVKWVKMAVTVRT